MYATPTYPLACEAIHGRVIAAIDGDAVVDIVAYHAPPRLLLADLPPARPGAGPRKRWTDRAHAIRGAIYLRRDREHGAELARRLRARNPGARLVVGIVSDRVTHDGIEPIVMVERGSPEV